MYIYYIYIHTRAYAAPRTVRVFTLYVDKEEKAAVGQIGAHVHVWTYNSYTTRMNRGRRAGFTLHDEKEEKAAVGEVDAAEFGHENDKERHFLDGKTFGCVCVKNLTSVRMVKRLRRVYAAEFCSSGIFWCLLIYLPGMCARTMHGGSQPWHVPRHSPKFAYMYELWHADMTHVETLCASMHACMYRITNALVSQVRNHVCAFPYLKIAWVETPSTHVHILQAWDGHAWTCRVLTSSLMHVPENNTEALLVHGCLVNALLQADRHHCNIHSSWPARHFMYRYIREYIYLHPMQTWQLHGRDTVKEPKEAHEEKERQGRRCRFIIQRPARGSRHRYLTSPPKLWDMASMCVYVHMKEKCAKSAASVSWICFQFPTLIYHGKHDWALVWVATFLASKRMIEAVAFISAATKTARATRTCDKCTRFMRNMMMGRESIETLLDIKPCGQACRIYCVEGKCTLFTWWFEWLEPWSQGQCIGTHQFVRACKSTLWPRVHLYRRSRLEQGISHRGAYRSKKWALAVEWRWQWCVGTVRCLPVSCRLRQGHVS